MGSPPSPRPPSLPPEVNPPYVQPPSLLSFRSTSRSSSYKVKASSLLWSMTWKPRLPDHHSTPLSPSLNHPSTGLTPPPSSPSSTPTSSDHHHASFPPPSSPTSPLSPSPSHHSTAYLPLYNEDVGESSFFCVNFLDDLPSCSSSTLLSLDANQQAIAAAAVTTAVVARIFLMATFTRFTNDPTTHLINQCLLWFDKTRIFSSLLLNSVGEFIDVKTQPMRTSYETFPLVALHLANYLERLLLRSSPTPFAHPLDVRVVGLLVVETQLILSFDLVRHYHHFIRVTICQNSRKWNYLYAPPFHTLKPRNLQASMLVVAAFMMESSLADSFIALNSSSPISTISTDSSRADAAYASDPTAILHSKKHNQALKTVVIVALAGTGFTSTHATLEVAKPTCDVTQLASAGFVSRPVPPIDYVSQPTSKNRVNANPFPPLAILPS
ncbi:uncharacterized protein G2W53_000705 [Senna tora]|uniref:Uncharacterized protein n=1 Tax=Senna tora TaxID=362788 RepID=A0A834XG32_9FABA|nr:uncharacterized protein G2W53_000705 [Senna tora]